MTAIFMSSSDKHLARAKLLYSEIILPKIRIRKRLVLSNIETVRMYDYFEEIQAAVIIIYSAVESLSNSLIPEDFNIQETKNGMNVNVDKQQIERNKSTSEKLKDIIPAAYKISSPTKFKCWGRFKELEKLRNDIIHLKGTSIQNKIQTKHILAQILDDTIFAKIKAVNDLIKELAKLLPYHIEYPILYNSEPIVPKKINSWNDLGTKPVPDFIP
ncbi:hypothetical protein [Pedobacter sp. BMA]|uniref:hypothetical protein n=1 Tax=Pedobacter sp. BMA TaxID=1663685 RepID=UPI0006499999|nr:hypothetical protein [Pedobacter sp. BMA]KLT66463.1 hypothetical protein AB669_04515 [Pedobacter sp. BMA]